MCGAGLVDFLRVIRVWELDEIVLDLRSSHSEQAVVLCGSRSNVSTSSDPKEECWECF